MVGRIIFQLPSDSKLQVLEELIGYCFTDRDRLREALHLANGMNGEANKSLAMIGDRILGLVLVEQGYDRNESKGKRIDPTSHLSSQTYKLGYQ